MMGEDVTATLSGLIKTMLEILMMLLRWLEEHHNRHKGEHLIKPKIKFGKISKKALDKLNREGDKSRVVSVPRDKLDELNKIAKELGGQYYVMDSASGGKTAQIAVPESSLAQINDAVNLLSQKMFSEDKESIKIHGSDEAVGEDRKDIVNETLDYYDVPVYRVNREDGKQVNIVPAESEQEYKKVMNEAEKIADRLEHDIVCEKYTPSVPVDEVDFTVRRTDALEAANLLAAFGNDVELLSDGNELAVRYKDSAAEKINAAFGDTEKQISGIRTAVVDNTISISKGLVEKETENEMLVRIPGTNAQDHMWINKNDFDASRSTDKVMYARLDANKAYSVCDKNGNVERIAVGSEIAENWKTKNVLGNKDTDISHHGSDNLERLEIYDPVKNKLMSIELNVDTARNTLMNNGFTALAADRILAGAVKQMSAEAKEKFGFEEINVREMARKTDSVSNAVRESEIAHLVRDAEFKGDKFNFSREESICVFDKTSKKYTFVNAETSADSAKQALKEMGLSDIERNIISARLTKDLSLDEKKITEPKFFQSDISELKGMCWQYNKELGQAVIIRPDNENMNYAFVPPCTRAEFEKLLTDKNTFGLTALAAAEVAKCCLNNDIAKLVEAPQTSVIKDTSLTETQLTSKHVMISDGKKDIIVEPERVTADLLKKSFSVSDGAALAAAASIGETFKPRSENDKKPFREHVKDIKEKAKTKILESKEQVRTVLDSKGKASETHQLNQSERVK